MGEKTIALLGQPNAGKSTLFNALTGSKQHVGNWPGKTVERKEGFFSHEGTSYRIVDLPGTYSLSATIHHDAQLRAYYQRKRDEGKTHGCVMNAVKFKLICRIFAVVGRQQEYVNTEAYRR